MRSQPGVRHSLEQLLCCCLPRAQIVERIERHPNAARLDLKIALVCPPRFDSCLTGAPKAGGTSPDTELTPEALANMRDERFAEVLNELQVRGDKTKLMQLFGH
jgi:hypothetical protein